MAVPGEQGFSNRPGHSAARFVRMWCQLYLRRFIAMTRCGFLSALLLICSPFCFAQQPAKNSKATMIGSNGPVATVLTYEQHKQAAVRINELAGRVHSEADTSAVVSEIVVLFAKELPPAWASSSIRQRVAHAEYEAVRESAKVIAEQRIVDVWN